ncbi:hypothetical protein O1611_g2857 [Lasiodiplodia mahajangana]|uniref:Uncharacterized protein n=1 Tax=Lasiodiplodia mahajangana TaxID=1108764 RepID=A0ACC2JTG4_9PEZI|nr:hypothetical protein O1611_g2857 [Lasiodiplodia mahajangana]
MSAFSAINLEPEENPDEEVDTSRELHIDEALKRFQTALKLHAQGPQHYQEAASAYDYLFQSEIFHLPESVTEFDRAERHAQGRDLSTHLSSPHVLDVAQPDIDGGASSLPQTLYLAYKNHGQFALDGIRHQAKVGQVDGTSLLEDKQTLARAQRALEEYSAALDQDPSDAELWRRAARVAAFLSSARISRYCLEAAIELDDDPAVDEVEPPSLAEGFAGEQLKNHLHVLSDEVALGHPAMAPFVKKTIPEALKKYADPLPFLPDPTKSLTPLRSAADKTASQQCLIRVPNPSWVDLGVALLTYTRSNGVGAGKVVIEIPEIPDVIDDVQTLVERPKTQEDEEQKQIEERQTAESPSTSKEDQVDTPKDSRGDNENTPDDRLLDRSSSVISRKRSQSVAGLADGGEEEAVDQKRSKRTRRRETAGEALDSNTLLAAQLQPFQAADKNLFQMTRNIAENLGIEDKATLERLGEVIDSCASDTRTSKLCRRLMVDLRDSLTKFVDENAKILLTKKAASPIGLSSFLEHSKPGSQHDAPRPPFHETRGLARFVQKVNDGWMDVQEFTFQWMQHICANYLSSTWSDEMKRVVVQITSYLHEDIYRRTEHEILRTAQAEDPKATQEAVDRLVQMQFELHLDIYERITNPNSAVDFSTRVETKARLARWFSLAAQLSRERAETDDISLSMRFLWSSVFAVTLTEGAEREHVLQCWQSLRDRLGEEESTVNIVLPNNAVMPEVSALAADREISKLTTMDFFLGLFQTDLKDPVSVIESLEPVLNPSSVFTIVDKPGSPEGDSVTREPTTVSSARQKRPITETASQGLRDLWKFLLGTSTELRLFLWSRLGDAYDAIGYKTKQFSCFLKSIEMITRDLERDPYLGAPDETRLPLFMKMLKFLDDLLISALSAALNESSAFDIVDDEHLKSSITAVAQLSCILHVPSMYEDEVRVGMMQHASNSATFQSYLNKLREMQVRNWSLLYTLLKAGISQNRRAFSTPESERADYLAAIHQVLGLRKFCKSSNKIFLRMMRVELLKQHMIDNWEDYLGQVLYDLYGLKLGVGLSEVQDHGCPPEKLERRNTMALVARVSILAHRMPMKDLLKSDLKNTIEHMQQAIGQTKSNQQLIQNLRIFNQTMAKPIHPLRLYEAFKGKIAIDAVSVNTADSTLARHRWFFLLGMIAFTKFKGVDLNRRQTPGATDDLRIGATFLRQQLQFTPDQWDAWFRLAECFDYELDESVLWTADKMNKERADLVKYQRNAIHCYTLALSHSRTAIFDGSEETNDAIHDLYHKFGMRMYASSREPFAMEPFQHSDHKRFVIHDTGADTKDVHSQMQDYKVWRYAARLFKKAMEVKPKQWKNPYMYAKCIWKMYRKPVTALDPNDQRNRPTIEMVVKALEHSVEVVSALPKPRHGQDPILEPHYKIVSVLHKLVMHEDLQPQEAADILQRQPYAIDNGEHVEINDLEGWESYVIKTLTQLREKDRSNWQHRIFMRHARILFDENSEESSVVHALAAFSVLKESMLTKTMVMNVWKCDAERPGRHHVYTEQYVRFVVKLLVILKDRASFEAMLRRLRKKGADYYHFSDLWQTCCLAYLRLIRQAYQISPVHEDEFKSTVPEEFEIITGRINEWASDPASSDPALSALQEVIELKKLNGGLMKAGAIDDLINDCYTALYFKTGKSLPGPDVATLLEEKEQERIQSEARQVDKDTLDPKSLNPLSGILNPQSHENSGTEGGPGDSTPANMDGVQRPRKAGIRRADVLRRAEQAVLRVQEGPKPTNGKSRSSVSSGKTPAAEENHNGDGESDGDSVRGEADGDVEMKDDEPDRESSSVPGSVHDSADDESDLSDVPPEDLLDEDEAQQLMFPNLMRRSQDTEPESSGSETEETDSPMEDVEEDVEEDAEEDAEE